MSSFLPKQKKHLVVAMNFPGQPSSGTDRPSFSTASAVSSAMKPQSHLKRTAHSGESGTCSSKSWPGDRARELGKPKARAAKSSSLYKEPPFPPIMSLIYIFVKTGGDNHRGHRGSIVTGYERQSVLEHFSGDLAHFLFAL